MTFDSSVEAWHQPLVELYSLCVQVKQRQEEEKRQLCTLRDQLRPVVPTEQVRDTDSAIRY